MGLDKGDTVVRRRLAQKVGLVTLSWRTISPNALLNLKVRLAAVDEIRPAYLEKHHLAAEPAEAE